MITGVGEGTQNVIEDPEDEDSEYSDSDKDDIPHNEFSYDQEQELDEEELQENLTDMMEDDQPQSEEIDNENVDEENLENEPDADQFDNDHEQIAETTTEQIPLEEQSSRATSQKITRSGKTYAQVVQNGVDYSDMSLRKVKFSKDLEKSCEACHNLIHQEIGTKNKVQYDEKTGLFMARIIHDMRELCMKFGVSFAQQYSLKKGIKKFGGRAKAGAKNEVDQLYQRNCWKPIRIKDMTRSERKKAQECFMFITEKRDGTVKGRLVFNGKPTRNYITKEDSASPTASNESIAITCAIDAHEGRDVATADVPNAFIQTDMPPTKPGEDQVVMKITGQLVDMMVELDPELYSDYVVYEGKRKVIYVVILKALYGMLVASLLWYEKFRKDLESIDFVFNLYDPCVANLMVKGKQHTVRFHVDDIMSSHVDSRVNDKFLEWLNRNYGNLKRVSGTRGRIHEYLGMTIDFLTKGKVKFKMIDYVKKMLDEFPMNFKSSDMALSPASNTLFEVRNSKLLDKQAAETYHTFVAKGLFLCKRARPDIQPTIAVFATRVTKPNHHDWLKLVRLMKYLNSTRKYHLTLAIESMKVIKWYVDASFAVHPDFKSHTGGVMTLGNGAIQSGSMKQKLNMRSSREAEIVRVDDMAAKIFWTKLFIEAQGYEVEKNILFQDNKSSILLEVNGRKSLGKRSHAMNVRYFFITNQVEKGNVQVEYCPTDKMVADFNTKPLQGTKFREFCKDILGQ